MKLVRPCRALGSCVLVTMLSSSALVVPARADSAAGNAPAAKSPAFELVGVVKRDGGSSLALLQEPELTKGAPVLVRQGQSIGDYRLVEIEEDRVVLESAAGKLTVHMGGTKGPVTASPAPKPAPAKEPATAEAGPPPSPTMTAEESIEAEMKGTPGGKVMDIFKKAFGIGAQPQ